MFQKILPKHLASIALDFQYLGLQYFGFRIILGYYSASVSASVSAAASVVSSKIPAISATTFSDTV